MNIVLKVLFFLFFAIVNLNSFAQYEDDDLEFEKLKSKSIRTEKRKFNIHLEAGYSLSTIFGTQVEYLKDTLTVYKNLYNLDSYKIEPNYFPYGKINASFNFSEKTSLTFGIKYSRLGWKELAKFDNSTIKFRFYSKYDFDYIATPIAFNFHANKFLSFNIGHTFSFLISNQITSYEYDKRNGVVRTNRKTTKPFEDITGFKSSPLISQIFLGTEIGSKRIRFTTSFLITGNFIRSNIYYSSFSIETGILFKLFSDFE